MRHHIRYLMAGLLWALLCSCGSVEEEGTGNQIGALATELITARTGATAPATIAVPQEEILNNPGQYMRVNIRDLDRWDTMAQAAQNGERITWVDTENNTITLENGVVVATRGLPRDLMSADVGQVWAAIRAGGGNAQRTHEFLGDDDQISQQVLQCSIAAQGPDIVERLGQTLESRRFEEKCVGQGLQLTNIYWVNRNGRLLRSLQAVSPDSGYLQIDVF
ncbi:YjbF family lipoprotein [Cognatiyoonia sp. IB215446]|uniref:YjbF family lipoprotein n=1 Tax=Cognatiyoonia sp. IB215446 TaxID=3097355 RepID=UPI002A0B775B|nr:YjbF family lipoprotein [Cognatiyoonia sp. IB215446]MDX8350384.1 YjbF family lipoprotein [Cognatiyoonia sp. IB215446]